MSGTGWSLRLPLLLGALLALAPLAAPCAASDGLEHVPWNRTHRHVHFNADALEDLFVRDPGTGSSYFATSNGSGFDPFQAKFFGPNFDMVRFSDFNGDALSDLFVRDTVTGKTYFAICNGGGFDPFLPLAIGPNFDQISFWDFNADDQADLFMRDSGTGKSYYQLSQGVGFSPPTSIFFGPNFDMVLFGNFDGDQNSHIDLLARDTTTGQTYVSFFDGALFGPFLPKPFGPEYTKVEMGRYNGDDAVDLLVRDPVSGNTYTSFGSPGGFQAFLPIYFAPEFDGYEAHEDFNGDGRHDLFVRNTATGSTYFSYATDAGFGAFQPIFFGPNFDEVDFGDFNGDGLADLFVRDTMGGKSYIAQAFDGGFDPFIPVHYGANFGHYVLEQFDGDAGGRTDLLVRDNDGGLAYVAHSNGAGFDPFLAVHFASRFHRLAIGDFDGDLSKDLLVRDTADGATFVNHSTPAGFDGFLAASFGPNFQLVWPPEYFAPNDTSPGATVHAVLLNPLPHVSVLPGEMISFEGFATDEANEILPDAQVEWHTNFDGGSMLGTGRSFSTTDLAIGHHDITLRAFPAAGGQPFEVVFPVEVVPPVSYQAMIIPLVRDFLEDTADILNSTTDTIQMPLPVHFMHNGATVAEYQTNLVGFRAEDQMQPGTLTWEVLRGMVIDPMGINPLAPAVGDRVKVSFQPPVLNWTHATSGEAKQLGVGSFLNTLFVEWNGVNWQIVGNQEFELEARLWLYYDEGNDFWDISINLGASSQGFLPLTSASVEMPYLSGAVPSPGSPDMVDFDATSDMLGILPLPQVMEDGTPKLKARIHLGNYLGNNHFQDALDKVRQLQGQQVRFDFPAGAGPARSTIVPLQFGFDPGYFMIRAMSPPGPGPGLLRGDRLLHFLFDTTLLSPVGGPGTLGVELQNRLQVLGSVPANLRGDLLVESSQLMIDEESLDPQDPTVDFRSYPVMTMPAHPYDVGIDFCDFRDNCFQKRRRFVAP